MKAELHGAWWWLKRIWDMNKGPDGYSFVSYKTAEGSWVDVPIPPEDADYEIPNDGVTVYFCPNRFSEPRRKKEFVLPTSWFYADLDETDPRLIDELPPTMAWETSPGRYQAMWYLYDDEYPCLSGPQHRLINKKLNYFVNADKNGWSSSKVLRVPGCISIKHDRPFRVRVLWDDAQYYTLKQLWGKVKHVEVVPDEGVVPKDLVLPELTADAILAKYKVPSRARQLINARTPSGDRSDTLWHLECMLSEAGIPPEEVLVVVRDTVWNKFSRQRRELPQLWYECQKAHVKAQRSRRKKPKRKSKPRVSVNGFNHKSGIVFEDFSSFMARSIRPPSWLVEGFWSENAHGLIAGEPKAYKSLIAMDLAVSVASGAKFLGRYKVPKSGPVILIQEENTEGMVRDRLEKICAHKGLGGSAIPLSARELEVTMPDKPPMAIVNRKNFDVTDQDHLKLLTKQALRMGAVLVVLDPLYMMATGVDENDNAAVIPILRDLLTLKNKTGAGTLLVHHYKKQDRQNPFFGGERISGAGSFHRWFESAIFCEKHEAGAVRITPDHRMAAPRGSYIVEWNMGDVGKQDYDPVVTEPPKDAVAELHSQIQEQVKKEPGIRIADLARRLEIKTAKARRLVEAGGYQLKEVDRRNVSPRVYPR